MKWPCTCRRLIPPGGTRVVSSDQVALRHTGSLPYRCSLPGLTGFESSCCAGPDRPCHPHKPGPTGKKPRAGVRPRYSGLRVQGTATSPSSTAKRKFQWRKGWDSNPRGSFNRPHALQACLLIRSSTLPGYYGGGGGIRTHGSLRSTAFRVPHDRPL